ncbi:ATP-dependent zinc metalloprotease ftsh [Phtheirospermum japonicum]|uniref:ATP-dependent zinc metalloprotease ftsh n=1 Tax=Phtheirospermum japonicum TaxID=374723 RepID=A0A830C880_9LAMI|nr:ATP-dependent zinc metalloprotease ftsh [Phtheirospermum japonicum]
MNSTLTSPLQNPLSLFSFPLHLRAKPKPKTITLFSTRNHSFFVKPLFPLRFHAQSSGVVVVVDDDDDKINNSNRPKIAPDNPTRCNDEKDPLAVAKPVVYALFYVVFGFLCPFLGFRKPALAATAVTQSVLSKENEETGHKYAGHTRRLLEVASKLVKTIEEARKKAGNENDVEEVLKEVKTTKRALQAEIMDGLYAELRVLKEERDELMDRLEGIVDKVFKAKREEESVSRKGKSGGGDRVERLREGRRGLEREYDDVAGRIGEIEDLIETKETIALSVGVRELLFIERECEGLVERFLKEMTERENRSASLPPLTKLSKAELQKELKDAHRLFQEQMILSNVLVTEDTDESLSGQYSTSFALRIEQALRDSRKMQKDLESQIRKTMRKNGEERRFIEITPPGEVVKGYPDIELKWMFGKKEVRIPKAVSLRLFHGWKKWREDAKMDLKKSLLEDSELGKKYMAERQERILRDRDRVASRTWYNEQRNRWEMDPVAVPYAVSKKLVESARIRHDWAAMYVTLKGNDNEYYVDVNEFEMLFEDFGGFDALYLRMLAANIPTAVQLMWIPFFELDFRQQFLLTVTLCRQCFTGLWNSTNVSRAKKWAFEKFRNVNDDIMMMIVFPVLEFVIPYEVRMRLGMAWPEYSDVSVGST